MSLQYSIVFSILLGELTILSLLLIPIPYLLQKSIELILIKACKSQRISRLSMALFILVAVFFLDSFHKMLKLHSSKFDMSSNESLYSDPSAGFASTVHQSRHHHHHFQSHKANSFYSALFYAQRNVYLTGMVLLLFLVIRKFQQLIKERIDIQQLLLSTESVMSKFITEKAVLGDESLKQSSQISSLKKENEELKAIIKTQTTEQKNEYQRLSEMLSDLEDDADDRPSIAGSLDISLEL